MTNDTPNPADDTQRAGANARARGESISDNPFAKSDAMPAATGETIEEWQAKYLNWEIGWRAEDLIR